jgi:GNAT superfamily N-acetyltransferase
VSAVLRPASEHDVAGIEAVFMANEDEEHYPPGAVTRYLEHLVARGTVAVAELDGRLVAFGATVDTGRSVHLADLFVLPAHQGQGLGGRLLAIVFEGSRPRTTFASDDPRALPLYVRAGMTPLWPNLYLDGDPRRLPAPPAGYSVETIEIAAMAERERAWTGVDRGPDLSHWSGAAASRPFAVRTGREVVAVGLSRLRLNRGGHWIDHVQVAPTADPRPALLAALRDGAGNVELSGTCLGGPCLLLPTLLEAGFRIVDRDIYLASDPDLIDPAREFLNTGIL